ncbi:hypothetical protein EVAR_8185_1 [Eumeta japonica]|uniref:Uncharacterized protein n=1 Tax=Eumeta variegata TaxID=151549 RepID=A0A4C1TIN9_EUMVA|nr:hypothetical protein EVAR_8185_1 [Eumeta japonica]
MLIISQEPWPPFSSRAHWWVCAQCARAAGGSGGGERPAKTFRSATHTYIRSKVRLRKRRPAARARRAAPRERSSSHCCRNDEISPSRHFVRLRNRPTLNFADREIGCDVFAIRVVAFFVSLSTESPKPSIEEVTLFLSLAPPPQRADDMRPSDEIHLIPVSSRLRIPLPFLYLWQYLSEQLTFLSNHQRAQESSTPTKHRAASSEADGPRGLRVKGERRGCAGVNENNTEHCHL